MHEKKVMIIIMNVYGFIAMLFVEVNAEVDSFFHYEFQVRDVISCSGVDFFSFRDFIIWHKLI